MRDNAIICHTNLAKDYRGGERQTELLIRALARQGIKQRLVIRDGNALGDRLNDLADLDICAVASNPVSTAMAIRGADLAHAHDGRSVYSAYLAQQLFSVPYVLTRRVVNQKTPGALRSRAYGNASRLFAVSQAASVAMQTFGQDADVITDAVAEFAINTTLVDSIKQDFRGKILIGHVGALEESKGQQTIFEIARQASVDHPDWQFLLLGDGSARELFAKEASALSNLKLVGFVDNVGDYLQAFDIFVFPSRIEAVGSSLLDAMQAGLAIVASRTGGIPEIIVEGRNGILLEPDDTAGFYAALEVLLEDVAERERLEDNNRADVEQYSAQAMAAKYLTAYREILA